MSGKVWQNLRLSPSAYMFGKARHTSQPKNNSSRYAEIQPIIGCQEKEIP